MNRRRIPASAPLLLASLAMLAAPGCTTDGPAAEAPPKPAAPSKEEVFRKPVPRGAADDPRVSDATTAGDAVNESLAVIHQRLSALRATYDAKARTEGDLAAVTRRMRPLLSAARRDCDAVLRAAKDLRDQLPHARDGYAASAASYRIRAAGYRDPDLGRVTLKVAERFELEAAKVPERIALTETFIKRLEESQGFLAEADRCLRDTATALAVFSAGGPEPGGSDEGRTFRERLDQFIFVVAEYQEKIFGPRPPGEAADPGPEAPEEAETPPAPKDADAARGASPPASPDAKAAKAEAELRRSTDAIEAMLAASPPKPEATSAARTSRPASPVNQAASGSAVVYTERTADPLAAGSVLIGEVANPARAFRCATQLRIDRRSGHEFVGVMTYGPSGALGSRGVRGTIAAGGRLSMRSEWSAGGVSPEPIGYDGTLSGGTLSGTWRTATQRGQFRLGPPS